MGNKKGLLKSILPWLIVLMVISVAIPFFNQSESSEIRYDKFIEIVQKEKVKDVEIVPKSLVIDVSGTYSKKASNGKKEDTKFSVVIPRTETELDSLISLLDENGTKINVVNDAERNQLLNFIVSLLPYLILFGGMFFFLKMMSNTAGGNNKAFEFGNSRAKLEKNSKTHFSDVAGMDEEKEEVRELVDFLKTPKKFADMGAKIPRGVLLVGPPGTGKTLLARAVAGEANVPFYSISGSEFVEMFVGVGAGRVRDMFKKAKQTAPCIIFIDEIDAVGRQRGTGMGGGHDEREQTLNQLLVEMDGFSGNEGIIVLAATNRADVLDPALLRPGRFDRQIQVANPDKRARSQILKVHARNKRFTPDVNFDNIAQRTPGFSGAELSNVLNEAALLAVRQNHDLITMADIDEAVDRVMGGPAKKSRKYTERERRLVAYHEAGHALIGLTLEDANKVQKVTIVPRGQAGGYNLMTPKEETYFQTKSQLKATISGYMGGRVAEEVFFGDVSSGAHNDIEQATRIARMMVTELGMSELGPIQYDSENGQVFLGRDYTQRSNTHSGQIAYEIDVQVRKIIDACYQEATNIIEQNKEKLICIAEALLEHETLSGEDIESLYNTGKMLEHHDGTLTEEPVQEVKEEKPVEGDFNGYKVVSAPAPFSGTTLIQMLKIIEKEGETSDLTDTAQYLQALDKATTLAHYSRGKKLADPAFRKVNEQNLVTDEYIQKLIDSHATSYSQDDESESTTHFVIVDKDGMVVSATNTLGHFYGSQDKVNGFYLNCSLKSFGTSGKNKYEAGKRAIPITVLKELSIIFSVSIDYLVTGLNYNGNVKTTSYPINEELSYMIKNTLNTEATIKLIEFARFLSQDKKNLK